MSNPTVRRINNYLRRQGSPYAGKGNVFVQEARKQGVSPFLLLGIANAETSIGKAGRGPSQNNPYGLGGVANMMSFPSLRAATRYEAGLLKRDYIGQGLRTPAAISGKYVYGDAKRVNRSWANTVNATMSAMGAGGAVVGPQVASPGGLQKPGKGSKQNNPKQPKQRILYTNMPEIQEMRRESKQHFVDSLLEASRARALGEHSNADLFLSSIQAMKEAEQRQPTVIMTSTTAGKPRPSSKGPKPGKQFAQGEGTILGGKWTPGGGMSAHGSRPLGNWQSDRAYDLMAAPGTPIYALVDGIIDPNSGFGFSSNGSTVWGKRLTVKGAGNSFFYTHMGKYGKGIKPGARVKKGQLIGYVGDPPGFASHLHIGLMHGTLDQYIGKRGSF